jgi:hypothetical protein
VKQFVAIVLFIDYNYCQQPSNFDVLIEGTPKEMTYATGHERSQPIRWS